jgi:hypothetical protein
MTAKAFIEGVVAAKDPKCPLASALRLYIANYFRGSAPRYGLVDPASRLVGEAVAAVCLPCACTQNKPRSESKAGPDGIAPGEVVAREVFPRG